jgi:crossover junction endodeoxyribonuclease RuvC
MKYICGIDPGLSGAIAFYCPEADLLEVHDMPVHDVKGKKHIDLYQLGMLFDSMRNVTSKAIIEDPNAMPKQGVTSSFRFGFACGVAQGVVAANIIPMDLVKPRVWKNRMNVPADKDGARQKASQRLPKHAKLWPLKKHDGRAEAALLCLYGLEDY